MEVTVKLFAMLNRYAPDQQRAGEPFQVTLPAGSTIDDLVAHLGIPNHEVKVAFVDGRARAGLFGLARFVRSISPDGRARAGLFQITPGAEVGIFPPVGGG